MLRIVSCCLFVVCLTGFAQKPAVAQAPRPATLQVTVIDPSGAIIVGATVTVAGVEDATKAVQVAPVTTGNQGVATVPGLTPGRYSVQAAFPEFETRVIGDVRVRPGDNKQVVPLPIEGLKDAITVGQDRQSAAVDPRGRSFGTTLTREQLDALSDDPDVLRRQLEDMAGPGAVLKVDSFEGAALPPKAQIRSIRISRDQFAAENHNAGGTSIEIITQPGIGPIRGFTSVMLRGDTFGGRSPFTPTRGPEQWRNYNLGLNGTLVNEKSSFNVFIRRWTPTIRRTSTWRSAIEPGPRRSRSGRRATSQRLFAARLRVDARSDPAPDGRLLVGLRAEPGGAASGHHGHRGRGREHAVGSDVQPGPCTIPASAVRADPEPHQSRQLRRLQAER